MVLEADRADRRHPGKVGSVDHLPTVQHDRHAPADQRDVERLPLTGAVRRVLIGNQEAVDRAEAAGGFPVRFGDDGVFDLHLVPPAQIDAAVAPRRIPDLHVQLEIGEHGVGHQIRAALGVREHATHGTPLVRSADSMPTLEIGAVEQPQRGGP